MVQRRLHDSNISHYLLDWVGSQFALFIVYVLKWNYICLGESGKDFIDFIVKMCEEGDRGTEFSSTAPEPLAIMGDNILQLLTNSGRGGGLAVGWGCSKCHTP